MFRKMRFTKLDSQKVFTKIVYKIRKEIHKNETHKNFSQRWLTKWDSQKCFIKMIHKMRLTKKFYKTDSQNETHKNIS